MKKVLVIALSAMFLMVGCSSESSPSTNLQLDSKHKPLPDYVQKAPAIAKEAYVMAAQDPKALAAVPCYCGCGEQEGHKSNLDCFVSKMGSNNEVLAWDQMGVG